MKVTLYESPIFAEDAVGGVLPYQIIIEEEVENGIKKVDVIRKEYRPLGTKRIYENKEVLTTSMWHIAES